ncbi:MAG TPA: sensor histidine kinase KdpD [Candidatus Manganitrophaceae bacterium]|nr:sensor histidine kinase KdpD [Candidatus Manganitrophaceae bacterium]
MEQHRPDPDALLKRVHEEEKKEARGKLRVFFGAAAGVGKTFAMLEAAHEQAEAGLDVVIGWVETHGRRETEALVEGLELLPPRSVSYQETILKEFDLDAALKRRPTLILMDELAHTNAPGSRHAKRWQDVVELLDAGIHVYTAINVQHLESLNDVVTQITGIPVHETVPDSIIEKADEMELVDIPPEDLIRRLKEGKVYLPDQAEQAIRNFFRKGNLTALRELALRRTADRVDAEMQLYRQDHAVPRVWPAGETILVCVNPTARARKLIRTARRMAAGLHAKWIAVYVQTPEHLRRPESERDRVVQALRLAEQLGAETVTLTGDRVSQEILSYARSKNVSRIIVGKPVRSRWKELFFGSVVADLVRESGEIDIYVITGEAGRSRSIAARLLRQTSEWPAYLKAGAAVALSTVAAAWMQPFFSSPNIVMIYLLGVVFVASRWGRGPSILASVLAVAAFDFFFVVPSLSFAVSDTEYLITFLVMLLTALVISNLTIRNREQAELARERERRTGALYGMSRELTQTRLVEGLAKVALRHIREVFQCEAGVFLADAAKHLGPPIGEQTGWISDAKNIGVAQWAFDHAQMAGMGTDSLPGADALFLPLVAPRGASGVLAVRPAEPRTLLAPDQVHLLETFCNLMAGAIERARLAEEGEKAQVMIEAERMRNALLSAVSHDLRTPLAAIAGAVSSLFEGKVDFNHQTRKELIQSIHDEVTWMDRLVNNLLYMTRLEAGVIQVRKEPLPLEEVVGAALVRLEKKLGDRPLATRVPNDTPLVPMDGVLVEEVLINLLENALKYTPPGSPLELSAEFSDEEVTVALADRGQGIPPGEEERIFDKFYRTAPKRSRGVGLGLAICKGIVAAHGGRIWVENRPGGGALFRFTLPLNGASNRLEPEEAEGKATR